MTLIELSQALHAKKCETSTMAKTHGPSYLPMTKFTDATSNGLTKAVIAFLELHGCQAERINTMGRVLPAKKVKSSSGNVITVGKATYIPTTGTRGSADISSTIPVKINGQTFGLSVKWEVKMRDKLSAAQVEYGKDIESSGGRYFVIHSFAEFIEKYKTIIQ